MAKQLNTLSSADYAKWQYEFAMLKSGKPDQINPSTYTDIFGNYQDIDLYQNVPENNWQDQVFGRTGHTFNHNLSISGGSTMHIWTIKPSCWVQVTNETT